MRTKIKTDPYKKRMLVNLKLTECEICSKITDPKELKYNAKFAMYAHREICDRCADKLED